LLAGWLIWLIISSEQAILSANQISPSEQADTYLLCHRAKSESAPLD
jgi:hypothetical protein